MRIGIVELYCGESGKKGFYNNQELGIARAYKKKGYDVILFYPQNTNDSILEDVVEDSIRILYIPSIIIGNHSKYDWNILKQYSVDLIQIGSDNQIFAPGLIRFCDNNNILLYNYIGTVTSDTNSIIKSYLMKLLFFRNIAVYRKHKCFAKTIFVKNKLEQYGIKDVLVAHVGLDTSIIPNVTVDEYSIRREFSIPDNTKILLYVGRMEEYKRPFEALHLLTTLPEHYMLIMIGTGSLDSQVDYLINESNIRGRVIRIKRISNGEIHQYYKIANYFINFNTKEIFGMSILEAMYQGCTVIAFHAPGPDEIITDNIDGFLVNTIDEMRNIILADRNIVKEIVMKKVLEHFIWDKTVDRFDSWIKEQQKTVL